MLLLAVPKAGVGDTGETKLLRKTYNKGVDGAEAEMGAGHEGRPWAVDVREGRTAAKRVCVTGPGWVTARAIQKDRGMTGWSQMDRGHLPHGKLRCLHVDVRWTAGS